MLRTKIPMLRKVPVLSGQKVVLMYACELNPGLAEFLHPKPQAMDKAVECKDHEAAGDTSPSDSQEGASIEWAESRLNGCWLNPGLAEFLHLEQKPMDEAVEYKDHEAAGDTSPSNTTLAAAETIKQIPSGSNPTGPNTSQHQVSQLQELAKEQSSSETSPLEEKPVELEERGQFITEHQMTQIKEISKE